VTRFRTSSATTYHHSVTTSEILFTGRNFATHRVQLSVDFLEAPQVTSPTKLWPIFRGSGNDVVLSSRRAADKTENHGSSDSDSDFDSDSDADSDLESDMEEVDPLERRNDRKNRLCKILKDGIIQWHFHDSRYSQEAWIAAVSAV
jgi:hypothetical protein